VVVRNLPERPAEGLVKEELAREYKKGGCVIRDVRVVEKKSQSGSSRTAVITFSDPADVSKALEDSRNKRILGSLIDVEKLNSHSDERPRNGEHSEFDPKATRTLFVGNISREVLPSEVHDRFKEFGEILEIDIKKPDYALVQFVDIKSVVRAMRGMGNQSIAGQRVNLGFGLSVATKCVWCDGVGAEVTEKMLQVEFGQYGKIQDLIIDRTRGHALVYFDQVKYHNFYWHRKCKNCLPGKR
jgi:RNA recognition motif-containing protein